MKPNASEFTGITPLSEGHPNIDASLQASNDLLDPTQMFDLGNILPEEMVHIHTAEGSLTLLHPPESTWGAGSSCITHVVESTIKGIKADDVIRLDGCSAGITTYAQTGFIGQYGRLMYSKFPKRLLPDEDVAYLQGLEPEERKRALDTLGFISIEDGTYYTERWDGTYHFTAEILRAEREKPGEDPEPIFE